MGKYIVTGDNINDWFSWNGVLCTSYGIHVSEQPDITIPQERSTYTDVPGRSGSLTTLEGNDVYDDMTLIATCFIESADIIGTIAAWLRSSETVTFANRKIAVAPLTWEARPAAANPADSSGALPELSQSEGLRYVGGFYYARIVNQIPFEKDSARTPASTITEPEVVFTKGFKRQAWRGKRSGNNMPTNIS